jgi:exodeoxyribonuclease VII small subunit
MSDDVDGLTFEQAFDELETTVQSLEQGDLTLQESIALYERGMHLAQHCQEVLDSAELQVQQLTIANERHQMAMFLDQEPD